LSYLKQVKKATANNKNIELVILEHSTKEIPGPDGFTALLYQTFKELAPVLCKLSSKMEGERTLPSSFYEASITLMQNQVKTSQENQRSISVTKRLKSRQQNTSKLSLATYEKDYTPWPSKICPRNARFV